MPGVFNWIFGRPPQPVIGVRDGEDINRQIHQLAQVVNQPAVREIEPNEIPLGQEINQAVNLLNRRVEDYIVLQDLELRPGRVFPVQGGFNQQQAPQRMPDWAAEAENDWARNQQVRGYWGRQEPEPCYIPDKYKHSSEKNNLGYMITCSAVSLSSVELGQYYDFESRTWVDAKPTPKAKEPEVSEETKLNLIAMRVMWDDRF